MSSVFAQTNQAYQRIEGLMGAGQAEAALPAVLLPHVPVTDTELAACLVTLGVPLRDPGPYTDDIDLATGRRTTRFWVGAMSDCGSYKTEWLLGAWEARTRFETEHPFHPLVAMRAALEARRWWLDVKHGRRQIPSEAPAGVAIFETDSLRDASILRASKVPVLAFTGRAFVFAAGNAAQILETSRVPSATSPTWAMFKTLHTFNELLKVAKAQPPILAQRDGNQTLLLRADATSATVDKFHALL